MGKIVFGRLGIFRAVIVLGVLAVAAALLFFVDSAVAGKDDKDQKGTTPPAVAWTMRCQPQKEGESAPEKKSCEIFQRLIVKESSARVAEFAIGFPDGSDVARGVVVLPLGILLQPGVEMKIDESKPYAFKVRYCTNAGCFAYVNLDKDILDSMRKGKSAAFFFKSADGKDVNLSMTLSGFDAALKEIM